MSHNSRKEAKFKERKAFIRRIHNFKSNELTGSLNSYLDFTKSKFDWDRGRIGKHSEGLE